MEENAASPRRCIANWGVRNNTRSIYYWLPRFKRFVEFIADMVSGLSAIGSEDSEIALVERLEQKFILDSSEVWPTVGPYLFKHTLRSVYEAMYSVGYCRKPVTDLGFVRLDTDSMRATGGYQMDNWNKFPRGTREFLLTEGRNNLGLNACELGELRLLQRLLVEHGVTDANAWFCSRHGYQPTESDGIFAVPDMILAMLAAE